MSEADLIPRPRSLFLRVKCSSCGNEQIIFNRASTLIRCRVCDEALAEPTGGKARIKGEAMQELR
ncbi:MAG: 30S ribosomal protein S27e [Candidatus Bathyarchaeia archaeon]|nr:30S ribosomal protein S27e [Candidatus Bathyarchaeota archaeon]